MTYALIDEATSAWVSGPHDAKPTAPAGQQVIIIAIGNGETCDWSAAHHGFVDRPITPPPSAVAMLVGHLLDQGVLTSAVASAILAADNPE